jgi:hypothetical protein
MNIFAMAMANRKSAEIEGPDQAADILKWCEAGIQRTRAERDGQRRQHHHGRMTEREEEAHAGGALVVLHQLARDIVDGAM